MLNIFCPKSQTYTIPADSTAPTGVLIELIERFSAKAYSEYHFSNPGALTVHIGYGGTAAKATANAVASVAGTPSDAIVLLPGSVQIIRLSSQQYISGYSTSANPFHVMLGEGL